MIKLGSAFSGIGGFELGLHWAIEDLETVWQIEKDKYCQTILKKHWPNSRLYDDITTVNTKEMKSVDILCGGFPCQDISTANPKAEGLNGKRSGLFWELWRIISDFREQNRQIPIILLENVPAITNRGLGTVLGALSELGYDAEWFVLSAGENFGAPHRRRRWFLVAYANKERCGQEFERRAESFDIDRRKILKRAQKKEESANPNSPHDKRERFPQRIQKGKEKPGFLFYDSRRKGGFWKKSPIESPLCSVDDGIPCRLARLRALGNAIVPQCSEFIGQRLISSGLLRDMLCN